jgi:hypothetical protein
MPTIGTILQFAILQILGYWVSSQRFQAYGVLYSAFVDTETPKIYFLILSTVENTCVRSCITPV